MLKNYFIVSWRNLLRNKVFSFINVAGLAMGLTVAFLIYQYVAVERSYDRFHKNAERIYRLPISYSGSFASLRPSATTHPAMGPTLKADFPEVEDFARLVRASLFYPGATVSYASNGTRPLTFNEERVYLADQSFLSVFTFPAVAGDVATALNEPNSIAITETIAQKYFGDQPALGNTLLFNKKDFKVTAVLRDIPENSHLQFDMLLSLTTLGEKWGYDNWGWPEFYNYILLTPGSDPKSVEAKLPAFMERYLGQIWEKLKFGSSSYLQPITDIHLRSDLALEQDVNGTERIVYFLTILALFVLAIAWINYVNLSTAKSLERSKEVGLRKVSGASKLQLVMQFFFDAFLVNVLAIVLAVVLALLSIPYFEDITGKDILAVLRMTGAFYSFSFWGVVIAILILGILVVGFYPAFLLSSFNPALVLKGKFYKSQTGMMLRKGLVVFQYMLSIFLIAGTITIYSQLTYMQKSDLGYVKEQVLVVRAPSIYDSTYSSRIDQFRSELLQVPAVEQVAVSGDIPGHQLDNRNTIRMNADGPDKGLITYQMTIDENFIGTFGMGVLAGRNFNENDRFILTSGKQALFKADEFGVGTGFLKSGMNKVIINQYLAEKLGFTKPEDALGQLVKVNIGGPEYGAEVIGVFRNHHQVSLRENYELIVYYFPKAPSWNFFPVWKYFSLRLNTGELEQTIDKVSDLYSKSFEGNGFEYFFLDDHFNNQYKSDQQFATIFTILTVLAILIACLGLLGLSVFNVTQRSKEIGIRKVMGASISSILVLFSNDSAKLLGISWIISIPFVYMAVDYWLSNFAFRINIEWSIFLVPPLVLLVISVATIIMISARAAVMNPVTSLRHE